VVSASRKVATDSTFTACDIEGPATRWRDELKKCW